MGDIREGHGIFFFFWLAYIELPWVFFVLSMIQFLMFIYLFDKDLNYSWFTDEVHMYW